MTTLSWATMSTTHELGPFGQKLLKSLRLVPLLSRNAPCVAAKLVEELGDAPSVRKFMLVAHAIGAIWPEPVAVCLPCGCMMTHDEALILNLFGAVTQQDRPQFDAIAQDLLNDTERHHLYVSMHNFIVHAECGVGVDAT